MKDNTPKDDSSTSEESSVLWDSEIDTYYDYVGDDSDRIVYRKDHPMYKTLKSAMKHIGFDVDHIDTESKLIAFEIEHAKQLAKYVMTRILNDNSQLLDRRLVKARLMGDDTEADRITDLQKKRKMLGLRIIQ